MCIKSEFKEICLKLATNGRSDKGFLLTSKVCPQGVSCPCSRLYTCIKIIKMCIKSDFEEIILKLATYGQIEKKASRKLLRLKVTPDLHLRYIKNGETWGWYWKWKNIACLSILLKIQVKYTYLYLFKFVLYSIVAFNAN